MRANNRQIGCRFGPGELQQSRSKLSTWSVEHVVVGLLCHKHFTAVVRGGYVFRAVEPDGCSMNITRLEHVRSPLCTALASNANVSQSTRM